MNKYLAIVMICWSTILSAEPYNSIPKERKFFDEVYSGSFDRKPDGSLGDFSGTLRRFLSIPASSNSELQFKAENFFRHMRMPQYSYKNVLCKASICKISLIVATSNFGRAGPEKLDEFFKRSYSYVDGLAGLTNSESSTLSVRDKNGKYVGVMAFIVKKEK